MVLIPGHRFAARFGTLEEPATEGCQGAAPCIFTRSVGQIRRIAA
jgi:hypothetical protein